MVRVRASRKKQLAFLSTSMYKVIENKERRIVDEAKMYYNSNKTNMHWTIFCKLALERIFPLLTCSETMGGENELGILNMYWLYIGKCGRWILRRASWVGNHTWNTIQQQKTKNKKTNELELQVVVWINLKNVMLSKVCLLYCIVYINLKNMQTSSFYILFKGL